MSDFQIALVVGLVALVGAAAFFLVQDDPAPESAEAPLFERLGGMEAVSAVVAEFAQRLFDDPRLEPFFGSLNEARQQRFVRLNVEFVCMATGGPCEYTGRSMFDAHAGLGTSDGVFDRVKNHLVDVLNEFVVPRALQRELLALVETTRSAIVER